MADNFKYIINASLKLNTGSLTKLLEDVKQVDREIKAHFEKANGGVRVPITVDKDISKFQGQVSKIVEGYNSGQAPAIKLPVELDNRSITKLQNRIAEIRKQLNSLSDEQARVSINTSLVVGRNEGEEVQKQVEGIKPTVEVRLIANAEDLRKIQDQISAIKAEVQTSITTIQPHAEATGGRVGHHRRNQSPINTSTSSVGRTRNNASRAINVPRGQVDRFISERKEITNEISTLQNNIKLLEKEEKLSLSANEIQNRIEKLIEAQAGGKKFWQPRNEKGIPIKGESQVKSENFDKEIEFYKHLLQQADQVNSLKKQLTDKLKQRDTLERSVAYKSPSNNKPTPRSHISPDSSLGQAIAEIEAQKKAEKDKQDALDKAEKERQKEVDKAEKKRQTEASKAEQKRQLEAKKASDKEAKDKESFEAKLQAEDRRQMSKIYSRKKREVESSIKRASNDEAKWMDSATKGYRVHMARQQSLPQKLYMSRYNSGRGSAENLNRKFEYQKNLEEMPNRYVDLNQQKASLSSRVAQLKDLTGGYSNGITGKQKRQQYSPQALAHIQSVIDKLNKDIASLDDEINAERIKLQEHVNKLYGGSSQGIKLKRALLGGNNKVNPQEVLKSQVKTQTVANVKAENDAKMKAFLEAKAQQELEQQWKQTGASSELPSNGRVAKLIAKNQARQEYLNRRTQSVSQAKNDYDTHTRRYGGNKEYSGTDLEAMLKDPNVNLQDSLDILKNKINPHNARQAYANKQGFQKAYSISYKDDEGNIRNIRTLTYEYTKLGQTIERGDKGFSAMLSHIGTKVGVFSLLEGAMFGVIGAVSKGIEDMAKFDAQLAEVMATTKDLNSQNDKLQSFYSQGQNGISGTSSMESQVQNDTFKNAETYGVSALNTVMPIEQQVIARHNLVSGNGGYDSTMKDQIVNKIMQFSAISTGGEATPEETNDLTKDALSLYQAYYNPDDPKQHINKMNSLFDNLTSMRMQGVNTTAVTDAMAELAPDTLTAGIDSNQVISALGAYNLSDASATGDDIQTVGRTFFGSLRHANTNDNLKRSLQSNMGIDLNSQTMSAPDLLNKIIQIFPTLNHAQQEQFAQSFSGSSGKGQAMTPKMVKLLQSFGGSDYKNFMGDSSNGKNDGAMDKSWLPFSERLKTNFDNLVEKLQEFTQLIGRLGVLDGLNSIVYVFNKILDTVNAVLRATQNVSDFFNNNNIWNIPKHTIELVSFMTTLKALSALLNKAKFGGAIGDLLAGNMITRRIGVKTTAQRVALGETAVGETIGTMGYMIPPTVTHTVVQDAEKVATQSVEKATETAVVDSAIATTTKGGTAKKVVGSVGSFLSDMLFLGALKGKGGAKAVATVAEDGVAVASKTGLAKFGEVLLGLLPTLRTFGLLLGRMSLLGVAITGAIWAYDAYKKHQQNVENQDNSNTTNNFEKMKTDSSFKDLTNKNIDRFLELDGKPLSSAKDLKDYAPINEWMKTNWQIKYNGNPGSKDAYVSYHDKNNKELTAHISNPDEMKQFRNTINNNGITDVQKLSDAWKVSTDSMKTYSDELTMIGVLSKNLAVTMNQIATSQKEVDARYAGVTSSGSLQEKIALAQKGLADSKQSGQLIQAHATDINVEFQKSQKDYNDQVDLATSKGLVSHSDIQDAITKLEVAKANNEDINTIIEGYSPLDPTDSTDKKKIKSMGLKGKDLTDYNEKNGALKSVLQTYQEYSASQDLNNQGQDALDNYLNQKYQYEESIKQSTAQLMVAKLGLDAFNSSLQQLGAIASASKTMVDMKANVLQSGDNSAQIGALHQSMQVSNAQMGNMLSQQGTMQDAMKQIKSANPSQDFSLNSLYDPQGEVTPEQMAYKNLYEQSQQMTQSISSQSSAMYEQVQQLRDLVFNSTEYADSWQRIQQTVQDVKEAIKSTNDFQYQMATLNDNSLTTAGVTGQKLSDVRQQQLQSLRDSSLQVTTKLTTDQASFNNDIGNLNQAWTQVMQQEGQNFNDNMIKPLQGIISSFSNSDSAFGSNVNSFGKAVDNFNSAVGDQKKQMDQIMSDAKAGAPAPSSSNYQSASTAQTGTQGPTTNTGQSFKTGFSEQNYATSLSSVSAGNYKGNEQMFVYAGAKYGVDPNLLMAIAMSENSGSSNILNNSNNVGNIKATGSSPEWNGSSSYDGYRAYSSLQQGINDLAHLIAEKIQNGYNTIPLINSNYAEDPNWMNNVAWFMAQETNTPKSQWLGNASSSSGQFNIGGGSAPSTGGGGGGNPTIQQGSTGSSVTTLQQDLGISADGIFGPQTRSAVINFQQSHGLSADGIVGPQTWGALTGGGGGGGSSPSQASTGGGGGVQAMFDWFNSILNNTGSMRYVWGGAHGNNEDWSTFIQQAVADCSGLVNQVYSKFLGVNLGNPASTNSESMWNSAQGTKVSSKSQLQPGDLVFFGSGGDASHVAVYAGNNQMYTIDHDGTPTTKEALWSDYMGGKHYDYSVTPTAGSPQASSSTKLEQLVAETNGYHDSITASIGVVQNAIPVIQQKVFDNLGQVLVNGNIADVLGTSGVTGRYDTIAQARQDIGAQMIANHDQINANNAKHDAIASKLNQAYASGDASSYNEYHAQLAYTDDLIKALQDNTGQLQSLDASYKSLQFSDPRLNTDSAHDYIVGGLNQLKSYDANGQTMGVDYVRVVNEVNTMKSQYLDHQKEAQSLGTLFNNYGAETNSYSMTKSWVDQDNINLVTTQIKNITDTLNGFAQGTQQWYSALQTTVSVQKQILDIEQQRLSDTQSNFENTGKGSQEYIQQMAYVQSKSYTNESNGLKDALNTYRNGTISNGIGYGLQMPSWGNDQTGQNSATSVSQYLLGKFGYSTDVVNADGGWTVRGQANLSQDQANSIYGDIYGSKIGAGWVTQGGYGLQMPSWYGGDSKSNVDTVRDYISKTWGYDMNEQEVKDSNGSGWTLNGQSNLTQQNAGDILNDLMGKYIGAGWVKTPNMYDQSSSYGLATQTFSGGQFSQESDNAQHYMGLWTGVHPTWVQDQNDNGGHWQANNLTNNQATNLDGILKEFGYSSGNTVTSSMDFNQQLASLQVIAETHNKMTQQMNDYKQAVTDSFKAGALSIDDYIGKLNQLRDVQTEAKDNAVNMVGNIQSGFSSALNDALTQGMQGSINSPLDFMNNIKQTISSSLSGQLTSTLLNNTGLQDVMNKVSTSLATASTSGDPNAIVNMFNNNDFGKQMQDAIAPFLPMIQQIVGSTKGIFTILKDQVFNSPSGFKIDKYMNEVASTLGYQGIKTMNPNINSVGSPTLNFPDSNNIDTTAPSQTPTGIPTGISGVGATATGAPENTTGSATTGAPSSSDFTSAPAVSNMPWQSSPPTPPPPPPPPAPAPSSSGTYTVVNGDTLSGIGAKLGVDWNTIASINGIGSPYTIFPGQTLKISGGSSSGGGSSASGTKHTSSALYFHSSPAYGDNVMGTIPQGAGVTYYGLEQGWAKVSYNGQTGYVGPKYLYHTGGIAGVTNFASAHGLKPNELSAILQQSETIFQPRQLDDLVNGAMQAGANSSNSGGGVNINVTVNFSGDTSDKGTIEQTVNTAVQKALQEFKKTTRLNNLSWKGTSY